MSQRPKAILCLCHDSNMLIVRRMLLEHFGYTVLPTTSAEDARNLAEEKCPDMLLMDNADAEVDFRKLAEQVKTVCPDVITVVLSPYYGLSGQNSIHPVDRFVAKDDGPDGLIAQIQELLGEANDRSMSAG